MTSISRLITFFALTCLSGCAYAALPEAISITAATDYVSAYTFRGDKIAGASIQPGVNVEFGSIYANVWSSRPLHRDELTETDLTLGYTFGEHIDLGLTAYMYEGLPSSWEPYIGVSFEPGSSVKTSLYVYHDWVLHVSTLEGKVSKSLALSKTLNIDTSVAAGTAGGRDLTKYEYWSVGTALQWQTTEKLGASIGASYRSASTADHSRDQWVYTAGFSYAF